MALYARINDTGSVVDIHVLAEAETGGAQFLADLWGGDPSTYLPTETPPAIGSVWDGKVFSAPMNDYARGKADGASELMAMQANVTEAL